MSLALALALEFCTLVTDLGKEGITNFFAHHECNSMYSNWQVEDKRFWASVLTFGDIHALIAKAEHSRQVLHDTLE